jgi:hypothetical protein
LRVDNQPYGNFLAEVKKEYFYQTPYRWATIGSMSSSRRRNFREQAFKQGNLYSNNAVLIVNKDFKNESKLRNIQKKPAKNC